MRSPLARLAVPRAAPETRRLAVLRRTWIALSLLLATSVLGITPLIHWFGPVAALVVGLLLVVWPLATWLYWRAKISADTTAEAGAGPGTGEAGQAAPEAERAP